MKVQPLAAVATAALVGLALAASGCAEEEDSNLFDENGAWELVEFSLEGGAVNDVDRGTRREAFLLRFNSGVVQTASCGESENNNPTDSTCRFIADDASWFCQCFAYTFEGSRMAWKPFEIGDDIPPVNFPVEGAPEGSPSEGSTEIMLSEVMGISFTYRFEPLPDGVFGSDGEASKFVFEQKSASTFNQVYDDPDGRAGCEPCYEGF